MQDLIKTINGWSLILKLIFCIPMINIFYGVCRIINQVTKPEKDVLLIVIAILTVVPGAFFMWLVDLIWIIMKGHAFLLG